MCGKQAYGCGCAAQGVDSTLTLQDAASNLAARVAVHSFQLNCGKIGWHVNNDVTLESFQCPCGGRSINGLALHVKGMDRRQAALMMMR